MTDDSEEVFRRAADGYPLRTNSGDWEAVREKMVVASQQTDDESPGKQSTRRRWLLLFLLLPLAVIEHNYRFITSKTESEKGTKRHLGAIQTKAKESGTKTNVEFRPTETMTLKDAVASGSQDVDGGSTTIVNATSSDLTGSDQRTRKFDKSASSAETNTGQSLNAGDNSKMDRSIMNSNSSKASISQAQVQTPNKKEEFKPGIKEFEESAVTNDDKYPQNARNKAMSVSKPRTNISITDGETAEAETASALQDDETAIAVHDNPLAEASTNDSTGRLLAVDRLNKKLKMDSSKTIEKASIQTDKKKMKQPRVYAGVIGALDFSSIKFQSVEKTGFSFGFIAGYKFNNRWSLETGLMKDKKQYTSAGKYFSTKNIPIYSSATIESVSGECNMWEVPLNLNYSFSKKTKSSWFVSAGASAYFMQKEAYVFQMNRYGLTYPYAAEYKNKDNEFLAVLNVSGGYTHQLGRICDVRIQPYIKIPVSKVGTGELPIQSAGLLLGFTRNLF